VEFFSSILPRGRRRRSLSCYAVQLEPIWVSKNCALMRGEVRAFYVACSVVFIGLSFYVLFVRLRGPVVNVNI
jgi:hypothetical protein